MTNLWVVYVAVFVAVALGLQAMYLIFFQLRTTQKSINRRLALSKDLSTGVMVLDALKRERGFADVQNPTLRRLYDFLMQTGLTLNRTYLALSIPGLTLVFFLCFGAAIGFDLSELPLAFVAASLAIVGFLRLARSRRMAKFGEQLPNSLDIIVRGVRVGHPFPIALGLVAREMPDPIGTEFGMTSDEINFGLDIKAAIENLYRRVGQEDLLFFVIAINIHSQTGGNLAEILARLAHTIRNRAKLRLKIRALTAEGRYSALVLTLMPFILFAAISIISPSYFGDIRHHPLAIPALVVGLTALLVANIFLYRMVNAKF